ncbi:hypothetical protein BDV95DRAFT_79027 [Massariosphaeria phaeospora]|uniref:Uncharacterized protein n=1 Tax=Massariosphaeria phaeospora TaxID=100035 RepID=A0A7C8IDC1_9PLEO|nr:hypothetical protein BDV95DRAFT_79027 [Massariosphaeria phaeospora]
MDGHVSLTRSMPNHCPPQGFGCHFDEAIGQWRLAVRHAHQLGIEGPCGPVCDAISHHVLLEPSGQVLCIALASACLQTQLDRRFGWMFYILRFPTLFCVLGASAKSRLAMFRAYSSMLFRSPAVSPPQECRPPWLTQRLPTPHFRVRGIIRQSPYLLMLRRPVWGITSGLTVPSSVWPLAVTACMVHCGVDSLTFS